VKTSNVTQRYLTVGVPTEFQLHLYQNMIQRVHQSAGRILPVTRGSGAVVLVLSMSTADLAP
jgi:hypothetical protein